MNRPARSTPRTAVQYAREASGRRGTRVTARSTEPVPPDLTALWASEIITRVDVEPLPRAATAALVGLLLGGTILDDLIYQVWERTRGVPLFVRELLLDAVTQHALTQRDDAWSVHGELGTGARLQ